jgi:hypothetical protein
MTDAPPPPEPPRTPPRVRATGWVRWAPWLLLVLVLVALALLARSCTDDDSVGNRPTYQGAAPGSSPPPTPAPKVP